MRRERRINVPVLMIDGSFCPFVWTLEFFAPAFRSAATRKVTRLRLESQVTLRKFFCFFLRSKNEERDGHLLFFKVPCNARDIESVSTTTREQKRDEITRGDFF